MSNPTNVACKVVGKSQQGPAGALLDELLLLDACDEWEFIDEFDDEGLEEELDGREELDNEGELEEDLFEELDGRDDLDDGEEELEDDELQCSVGVIWMLNPARLQIPLRASALSAITRTQLLGTLEALHVCEATTTVPFCFVTCSS